MIVHNSVADFNFFAVGQTNQRGIQYTKRLRPLFFSVKLHKIELSFVDDKYQQFILMEN